MIDFLKKMYEAIDAGISFKDFAKSIGKTTGQAYYMKYKYTQSGIHLSRYPRPDDWTKKEIQYLKLQINLHDEYKNIKIPGKSAIAIRSKAQRLKIVGDGVPRVKWSDEDTEILKKLVAKGIKRSTIQKKLNKTKYSVQQKIQRLGLTKRGKYKRKIPEWLMDYYEALLHKHYMTMTPSDISALWNNNWRFKTTPNMVRYHLKKLNIKCSQQHTWKLKSEKKKREEAKRKT